MAIQHYDGELGKFDYDDTEFSVDKIPENTEPGYFYIPGVKYIGNETDGSKIKIPEGVTNCRQMFMLNKDLKIAPKIPDGVENCEEMFMRCDSLETFCDKKIPESVTNCINMFADCKALKDVPILPQNDCDFLSMFAGCKSIVKAPELPIENGHCPQYDAMFKNCESLEIPPSFVTPYVNCDSMFENCISLKNPPKISFMYSADAMFKNCTNLVKAPVLMENIKGPTGLIVTLSEDYTDFNKMLEGCSEQIIKAAKWNNEHPGQDYYDQAKSKLDKLRNKMDSEQSSDMNHGDMGE